MLVSPNNSSSSIKVVCNRPLSEVPKSTQRPTEGVHVASICTDKLQASLAQLVEHFISNEEVVGSSPARSSFASRSLNLST
jgi:hypothetical protein